MYIVKTAKMLWLSFIQATFPSHCSKLEAYLSSMNFFSHHPSGITVEIVGIESGTNGRSYYQHDICGSLVEEDVVLRLRKIQIRNSFGQKETAIAAFHVTDGIDQCHAGFLPRHFVPHAPSFDGVLVQVTEVYSPTSESVSKRKKFRHNMGCCLATLITELPAWAAQANKSTVTFLTKIEKEKCDDDDNHTTRWAALGFVGYDDEDCAPMTAIVATATATRPFAKQWRTEHAAAAGSKECITPTAIVNKVAVKTKASHNLTPSRRSNRVLDQNKAPGAWFNALCLAKKEATWWKVEPEGDGCTPGGCCGKTVAKKGKQQERDSWLPPANRCG